MIATLQELSVELGVKQPKLVDNLFEETSVLQTIRFEPSSHPMWNVYEEVTEVKGGGFRPFNAPAETMSVNGKLTKIDLGIMGGELFCPFDTGKAYGGKEKWFAKKTPAALRKLGVDAEKTIIYGNLRQYAIDNGKVEGAGGDTNNCYTILIVRWIPGETIGIYSPEMVKSEKNLFGQTPMNGGGLYKNAEGVPGHGLYLHGYFGIQLANVNSVSAIVNCNAANVPTSMMVDDALAEARANPGNTKIYCHHKAVNLLSQAGKGQSFRTSSADKGVNTMITDWNGIEVVPCYNFMNGTEAAVAIP